MTPRRRLGGLVAALLLHAAAIAAPVSVPDGRGGTLTLAQPAQRIVALGPHLTEIAFAAGAGERLVGVMRYSDHPPAALTLPVVGDAFALNLERIAQLHPDLVLVWADGIDARRRSQLERLGLPLLQLDIRRVDDIADALRRVGTLAGVGAAERLAAELLERWQRLRVQHAGRAPVRVFYQLWHEPLMTVNGEHLIHQAIAACGGVNAFADVPVLTPTLSWEAAVRSDPQLVVSADSRDEAANFGRWREFARVQAVRHGALVILDGNLIARMGPRFVDGARQLCDAIDRVRSTAPTAQPGSATQVPPASRQGQP